MENRFPANSLERTILELIAPEGLDINSMVRILDRGAGEVSEAVMTLELSGAVLREGNIVMKNIEGSFTG